MNNKFKNTNINGIDLTYFEENNNKKKTILFIHGFNSSTEFMEKLISRQKKFNIIALNLPGTKFDQYNGDLTMPLFKNVVNTFINKKIKQKKIIILGHSLGGAIVSSLYTNKKITDIIYLSPLSPSILEDPKLKVLKSIHFPKNKLDTLKNGFIKTIISQGLNGDFVNAFISKDSKFIKIIKNNILDNAYMDIMLRENFIKSNNKKTCHYLIGDLDNVINPNSFKSFVTNELKSKVVVINNSKHNPIDDNTQEVLKYLIDNFSSKDKWFKTKITKN